MRYLMLIYGSEELWNSLEPATLDELIGRVDAFNTELRDSGELVAVEGLVQKPASVRAVGGIPVVTDGPYLETKEIVGSYFVVDVDSAERAREIAAAYPGVQTGGAVELWPLMERGGVDL